MSETRDANSPAVEVVLPHLPEQRTERTTSSVPVVMFKFTDIEEKA